MAHTLGTQEMKTKLKLCNPVRVTLRQKREKEDSEVRSQNAVSQE